MPRSEKKKGFFGDEYTETRDDSGQKISESREKTGFFGDKYTETTDASGHKVGESREKTGFFGDKFTETTDPSGRKLSESREKTGFFGDKYVETTDPSGSKISESRRRTGFFGDKYTETTEAPRPRKPSTDWAALFDGDFSVLFGLAFKLFLWLSAIVFVIWLVMMALAITVMLAPIWLGAVTVGVITGFLVANSAAEKLSEETLSRVPVVEEQKRKKTRFRVSEDFLKAAIKFNPHILSLIAATAAYCIALAGWPLFTTSDTFTQILLGVGSVAGTILGTLAGRRVLLWQYENRIFERAESEDATRLVAPKVALGFSIPGLIALAGVGIFALVQSSGQVDFARAFGFKSEAQLGQTGTIPEKVPSQTTIPSGPTQTTSPSISSDVAFIFQSDDGKQLRFSTPTGRSGLVTQLPPNVRNFFCANDGSIVVLAGSRHEGPPQPEQLLWLGPSLQERFTRQDVAVDAAISNNGQFLAYSRVVAGTGRGSGFSSLEPNDHPRSEIVVRDQKGVETVAVQNTDLPLQTTDSSLSPSSWSGSRPAGLSPDGKHLFFYRDFVIPESSNISGRFLFHADLSQNQTRQVVMSGEPGAIRVIGVTQGRSLLHSLLKNEVVVYDLETRKLSRICSGDITTASLSFSGEYAAVLFWESGGRIDFYRLSTGERVSSVRAPIKPEDYDEHTMLEWTADDKAVLISGFVGKPVVVMPDGKVMYPIEGNRNSSITVRPGVLHSENHQRVSPRVKSAESFSVEVVDGVAPGGGGFEDRSLVLRQGNAEIGRFPTFGYVLNFYASPDQRFVAVNNRRGNSGDYLWIIGTDGRVLKRPEDELGQRIEREAVERASRVAQQRSPEFQGHKTWINAVEWKDDTSLSVIVRALHIIPNRDSLKQDVRVTLAVSRNGVSIENIAVPQEVASPEANVESFIRSRLLTESSHDIDRILGNYANRVNYWDNGVVDRDFIRKDKATYFERWPVTLEEIEGPINVTRSGDDWIARFKTRFRVENPAKGVVIQGLQEATYTLQFYDGAFKIAGENGQVLEKQKFENAPMATSPAQQGNYPGERFPETRMVPLAVQDLQKLSADDLRYAINELFARYGADFPKEEIKRQFSRFSWYRPRVGLDFDEIESRFFTDLERENLKRLGEARETAGSRGSTAQSPVTSTRSDSSYSGVYSGESVKTKAGVRVTTSTRLEINGSSGTLRVSEVQVAPPGRRLNKEGARTAQLICQYTGRLDNVDNGGFSFVVQRSRQLKCDPPGFWNFKSYDGYRIGVYAASGGLKIGTEDGEQFLKKQ